MWQGVVAADHGVVAAGGALGGVADVVDGEAEGGAETLGFSLCSRDGGAAGVAGVNVVAGEREPDRLRADPTRAVEHLERTVADEVAQQPVKDPAVPLNRGVPVFVKEVVVAGELVVSVGDRAAA